MFCWNSLQLPIGLENDSGSVK